MSEIIDCFQKLGELCETTHVWEDIDDLYEEADEDKEKVHKIERLPVVQRAIKNPSVLSHLRDTCSFIRNLRESTASYDNTYDSWDSVSRVIRKEHYLSFIYALVGLGGIDPTSKIHRQLSIAAANTYFLSLTIPGAKGYHIFEEKIISHTLRVFNLVEKIKDENIAKSLNKHERIEVWVNLSNFCDVLKLTFRYVHFNECKEVRNQILQKLIDLQYLNHEHGYENMYAVDLHKKIFQIFEEVTNAQHGDTEETFTKMMKMTLFLHIYPPKPKNCNSFGSNSTEDNCEHISDWFVKMISKFPRILLNVLHFYIKYLVTNPEKNWKTEQMQRTLDYAAKYDAALYTNCNESIIPFLSEAIYADDNAIRARSVELLSRTLVIESKVNWEVFRHEVSNVPREVYAIKELVDTLMDTSSSIKLKAAQALHQAFHKGTPDAVKILREGVRFACYNDSDIELPKEPRVRKKEIRYEKPHPVEPSYTFEGHEIVAASFNELPQRIYAMFKNSLAYNRRAALMLIESVVKLNPLVMFNTKFCKEYCNLIGDPSPVVRKQSLVTIDAILSHYPNCYPAIWVWCKILSPLFNDGDPKHAEYAMECFKSKVLDNIKSIEQSNKAEHFMPWVIIRTLLCTQNRLYLQNSIDLALKRNMLSQHIMTIIQSHTLTANSTEAWTLLNFISGKVKSNEPDFLIHEFTTMQSWNNEQNLLIMLEILCTCVKDFSHSALNLAFKSILQSLKDGTFLYMGINKAFDLLLLIHARSESHSKRSSGRADAELTDAKWIEDLHKFTADKLIESMPHFRDNHMVFMSHLYTYTEANLQIRARPHRAIVDFIYKYILECINIPETDLDTEYGRIFNSMLVMAGRLAIRDANEANTTCLLYGRVLHVIDRPQVVNTILFAVMDLCKKHTQTVELILNKILHKLDSPYYDNRSETFKCLRRLVMQDQLKLRGNLLLAMMATLLDQNDELSNRACDFFNEFMKKKNPSLFQKCLIECPFVLNEYMNFDGLDSFTGTAIESPLKGEGKRKQRYTLYTQMMMEVSKVHLLMYFDNLKLIYGKLQSDPTIKSPQGIAMMKDIFFILKKISMTTTEKSQKSQPNCTETVEELPTATTDEATGANDATAKKPGRRKHEPTMGDAMSVVEKTICLIPKIAEIVVKLDDTFAPFVDDLSRAVCKRFESITEYAQPVEFWKRYQQNHTPAKKRKLNEANDCESSDNDDDSDNVCLLELAKRTPVKANEFRDLPIEYLFHPIEYL